MTTSPRAPLSGGGRPHGEPAMSDPIRWISSAETLGGRDAMEDRTVLRATSVGATEHVFAAVFDGHGGEGVAEIAESLLYAEWLRARQAGLSDEAALARAFAEVASATQSLERVGSTAAVAVVSAAWVTVAWLGDSRVAVVTPDGPRFVSTDHTCLERSERRRVRSAGAELQGRHMWRGLYGVTPTRAFGDKYFVPIGLIAEPSIEVVPLDPQSLAVIVVATDGFWDVVKPEELLPILTEITSPRFPATTPSLATRLIDVAIARKTRDNASVVAVAQAART